MPLPETSQPEILPIHDTLRLRRYDGNFASFLPGYQDPVVYRDSEGIFDEEKIPDLNYVERMCRYLSQVGELYYIEIRKNGTFLPVGDVTIKPENPPIAIWTSEYRGKGIAAAVMQTVIDRLKALGYEKITGTTIYSWNTASQKLHERLGFQRTEIKGKEYLYERIL